MTGHGGGQQENVCGWPITGIRRSPCGDAGRNFELSGPLFVHPESSVWPAGITGRAAAGRAVLSERKEWRMWSEKGVWGGEGDCKGRWRIHWR